MAWIQAMGSGSGGGGNKPGEIFKLFEDGVAVAGKSVANDTNLGVTWNASTSTCTQYYHTSCSGPVYFSSNMDISGYDILTITFSRLHFDANTQLAIGGANGGLYMVHSVNDGAKDIYDLTLTFDISSVTNLSTFYFSMAQTSAYYRQYFTIKDLYLTKSIYNITNVVWNRNIEFTTKGSWQNGDPSGGFRKDTSSVNVQGNISSGYNQVELLSPIIESGIYKHVYVQAVATVSAFGHISVLTSDDGSTWTETALAHSSSSGIQASYTGMISISGYKYIRFRIYASSTNSVCTASLTFNKLFLSTE